jgi:hypothetical protein
MAHPPGPPPAPAQAKWLDRTYNTDVDMRRAYAKFHKAGATVRVHPKILFTLQILEKSYLGWMHRQYKSSDLVVRALQGFKRHKVSVSHICDIHKLCVVYTRPEFWLAAKDAPERLPSVNEYQDKSVRFISGPYKGLSGVVAGVRPDGRVTVKIALASKPLMIETTSTSLKIL